MPLLLSNYFAIYIANESQPHAIFWNRIDAEIYKGTLRALPSRIKEISFRVIEEP